MLDDRSELADHSDLASRLASPRSAREDLAYIRRTLDAAGHLSIVPGKGMVIIGVLALAAVVLTEKVFLGAPWGAEFVRALEADEFIGGHLIQSLLLWGVLLVISLLIGSIAMWQKARRTETLFWSPALRRALWAYSAAMAFGGIMTIALLGQPQLLPGLWLGCYGIAMVSAGTVSISPIRWMGLCFLGLSAVAALTRLPGSLLLAAGFGWLHIGFGAYIAWRHDG